MRRLPVDIGILIAVATAVIAWFVMKYTQTGFLDPSDRRQQPGVASVRDPRPERVTVQTFLLAGAFAGLAGSLIVQGRDHSLLQDFSANLGFLGIGVALVARLHPLWIIGSALFFAILRVGSNSLQAGAGSVPGRGRDRHRHLCDPPDGDQGHQVQIPGERRCSLRRWSLPFFVIGIQLMVPIVMAALGEAVAEKSGVLNVGIEGMMLIGAFATAYMGITRGSATLGILAAVVAGLCSALSSPFST